ncbi:MAG TPA: O-antigen ligase family protein, partial [Devosia sp.]|nr:O-antigen ligase family protein [Devosia sp.]
MTDLQASRLHTRRTGNTVTDSSSRTRLNTILSWVIVALLAVSPIPLGGTPPIAWTIWGMLVSCITIAYLLLLGRSGRGASFSIGSIWPAAALHGALCLYLIIQVLPLGRLFGGIPLTVADGTVVMTDSISIAPGDTILTLVRMLTYGLLFYLTMQVAISDRRRQFLLRAIVAIVTAHALYALIALFQLGDTVLGAEKWKYFGSATGTFVNRNSFATYLIFGLICALTLAASGLRKPRGGRIRLRLDPLFAVYLLSAIIVLTTVTATNSRMGFVLAWAAVIAVLLLLAIRSTVRLRLLTYGLPALLLVAAMLIFFYGETLWLRLEDSQLNFQVRLELYRQVIHLMQRPWLGFGGGSFEQAFPIVHEASLMTDLDWDKAHNTYLQLWSELGLIIGSIPIMLVGALAALLTSNLAKTNG